MICPLGFEVEGPACVKKGGGGNVGFWFGKDD